MNIDKKLKLGVVERQTLNQQVYESLKLSILKGDIKPETKLNEVHVAEQLNVSPTPVREAFRLLAAEGFVEIKPYKGVIVKKYSKEEVIQVYQCREALEVLAIQLAIYKINDEDIVLLKGFIEKSKETNDVTQFVLLNTKIHNLIINKSGNAKLKYILKTLDDVLLHDRNITANDEKRRKEIIEEHLELFNAIVSKDVIKAETAIRNHIRNGYNYINDTDI